MASADDTDAADDETAEQDAEQDTAETGDPAEASLSEGGGATAPEGVLSEGGGAAAPEGVVPFDQSVNYNGVVISVKADAGAFPAGATLSVMRVLLYEQNQADAAVDEVRDEAQIIAVRYTFDISILDENGNELQPAEGHSVEVSFALAEAADENLEANVYHIDDDMTAEKLDAVATDEAVTAVTDGFSLYTVEFTYEKREYILPGDSSVALSEILAAVGLKGAAEAVSVSAPELFSVEADAAGAWIVRANRAFTSTEWMRVTIGGIEYEITVTDAMWEPVTPALTYATVNITMKDGAQTALKSWSHTPIDGTITGGTAWPGGSFATGRFEFTFSRPVEIDQDGVVETKKSETEYEYTFTTTQEPQESACEVNVNIAARFTLTVTSAENGSVQAYCGGAPVTGAVTEGETITLTVAPDVGYTKQSLTVSYQKDGENKTIAPDENDTFEMPAGDATVTAAFALTDPEAKIDGTPYPTLDDALTAAAASATIVLCKDISPSPSTRASR